MLHVCCLTLLKQINLIRHYHRRTRPAFERRTGHGKCFFDICMTHCVPQLWPKTWFDTTCHKALTCLTGQVLQGLRQSDDNISNGAPNRLGTLVHHSRSGGLQAALCSDRELGLSSRTLTDSEKTFILNSLPSVAQHYPPSSLPPPPPPPFHPTLCCSGLHRTAAIKSLLTHIYIPVALNIIDY